MKIPLLAQVLLCLPSALATQAYKGFNLRNSKQGNGTAKLRPDWDFSFQRLKTIPGNYNAARLYSVTDSVNGTNHNFLLDALPSAQEHDVLLLLGLYLNDQAGGSRFEIEFDALKDAIAQYGTSQVIGISVGNEDLYGDNGVPYSTPHKLAEHITKVKQWTQGLNDCIPVGHTDTWGAITDPKNQLLFVVSDFLIANIFPFWQPNVTIDTAKEAFESAVSAVQNASIVNGNIDMWIGETGWATNYSPMKQAVASVPNLQTYWNEVACGQAFNSMNSFYYIDNDVGTASGPEFGVFDINENPKINFSCPDTLPAPASKPSATFSRRWQRQWNRRQATSMSPPAPTSLARRTCPAKMTMSPPSSRSTAAKSYSTLDTTNTPVSQCSESFVMMTSFVTQTIIVTATDSSTVPSSSVESPVSTSGATSAPFPTMSLLDNTTLGPVTSVASTSNQSSSQAGNPITFAPLTASDQTSYPVMDTYGLNISVATITTTIPTTVSTTVHSIFTDRITVKVTPNLISFSAHRSASPSNPNPKTTSHTRTPPQLQTDKAVSLDTALLTPGGTDDVVQSHVYSSASGRIGAAGKAFDGETDSATAATPTLPAEMSDASVGWDPRRVATWCGGYTGACPFDDSSQFYATATPLASGWWPSGLDGEAVPTSAVEG